MIRFTAVCDCGTPRTFLLPFLLFYLIQFDSCKEMFINIFSVANLVTIKYS